tara:strand:+ start:945 stop:1592 length:648 start_codon:yes stop_codon:yes gene_type:complete
MTIEGDSREYDLLAAHCETLGRELSKEKRPILLTAEIGVRKGLSTKIIMEYIRPNYSGLHFHIGIDPYGDLIYEHYDKIKATKLDYDEKMLLEFRKDFAEQKRFSHMHMTDKVFMEKYYYGVEFYHESKTYLLNEYGLVHFDGPHKTTDVINEAVFFAERAAPGAIFIFDDWKTYNTHLIRQVLNEYDFEFISNGERKMIMKKNDKSNKKDNSKT